MKVTKEETCFANNLLVCCKCFLVLPQFFTMVGEDLEFFLKITPKNIFGNIARYSKSVRTGKI